MSQKRYLRLPLLKKYFSAIALGPALLSLFIFGVSQSFAETEKLTGKDWLSVSEQRKLYYVFGKREASEYQKIIFRHTAREYIDWLDKAIVKNPAWQSEDMDLLFKKAVMAQDHDSL